MKCLPVLVALLFVSCESRNSLTPEQQLDFEQMARSYQTTYMAGSKNLDQILAGMDEDIQMWENGKIWTYQDMVKFGPHLPSKKVVDTYNEQVLLDPETGYDFVTLLYISSLSGDTLRESTSRIWKRVGDTWKIMKMSNLIGPESCN